MLTLVKCSMTRSSEQLLIGRLLLSPSALCSSSFCSHSFQLYSSFLFFSLSSLFRSVFILSLSLSLAHVRVCSLAPGASGSSALNWSSIVLGHFQKVHVRAPALPEGPHASKRRKRKDGDRKRPPRRFWAL